MKRCLSILFVSIFLLSACGGKDKQEEAFLKTVPDKTETTSAGIEAEPEKTIVKDTDELETEKPATKVIPPMLRSIEVTPQFPKLGDTIKVDIEAIDREGDKVNFTYEWTKNEEPMFDVTDTIVLDDNFTRGDKLKLIVIPYNENGEGTPGFADITVGNSPPEIVSSPDSIDLKNRQFSYQIKATDRDGDTLAYALKKSPSGMSINEETGLIQWDVPREFKGKTTINISVTDGHDGEGIQNFVIEIMAEATE